MNPIEKKLAVYREDFSFLEDATQKAEFIIELGKSNTPIPSELKTDENLVQGCASKAWLILRCEEGRAVMQAEGDSALAKGMIALLLDLFNGQKAEDILHFDPKKLYELGLDSLLSPVRQQGLEAFLGYLYGFAKKCEEEK